MMKIDEINESLASDKKFLDLNDNLVKRGDIIVFSYQNELHIDIVRTITDKCYVKTLKSEKILSKTQVMKISLDQISKHRVEELKKKLDEFLEKNKIIERNSLFLFKRKNTNEKGYGFFYLSGKNDKEIKDALKKKLEERNDYEFFFLTKKNGKFLFNENKNDMKNIVLSPLSFDSYEGTSSRKKELFVYYLNDELRDKYAFFISSLRSDFLEFFKNRIMYSYKERNAKRTFDEKFLFVNSLTNDINKLEATISNHEYNSGYTCLINSLTYKYCNDKMLEELGIDYKDHSYMYYDEDKNKIRDYWIDLIKNILNKD